MVRRFYDFDNHLRTFIRIAQVGSIHEAGRTLGISQPALSKQLKQLEHELGVDLLRRTNKGIVLTDLGVAFLGQIQPLYDDIDSIVRDTSSGANSLSGDIVIGAVETFSRIDVVWDTISSFISTNPNVTVSLNTDYSDSILSHVLTGKYDMGIVHDNTINTNSFEKVMLSREGLNIVYNYSVFNDKEIERFPNWDMKIPMVNFHLDSSLGRLTAHYSKKFNIPVTIKVNSLGYLEEALYRGLGIAILPTSFALREDVRRTTRRHSSPLLTTLRGNVMIKRKRGGTSVAARKFMDAVLKRLNTPSAD